MYSVRFGDIENGIMYHLHWGESYGTDLGVAVIIQTIAHKNGLSNGQYSIYSYRPNNISYDIILVHETGMAVSGMKSGTENVVQTYIDGSSNTTERYYENGVFDYAKSGYSKTDDSFIHYIGRYYNKETNEYELMNMW